MSNLANLIQGLVVNSMSQNNGSASEMQSGGGLGDMLGGALGGLMGGQNNQSSSGMGGMLGSVLGGLTGGQSQGSGQNKLMVVLVPFILNWIQQQGGFKQAVSKLTQSGLGQEVQSWVSNGDNQPVDASKLSSVFPEDDVAQVAKQADTSSSDVYSSIANVLPQVVNAITANGQVAGNGSSNQIQQVMGMLGALKF